MKRSLIYLSLVLVTASCNKAADDFIWEKSLGPGTAYFIRSTSDSGFVSCGTLNGYPYFVKHSKTRTADVDYTSGRIGLFSALWSDTSRFIAGGSSDGKMMLACVDKKGRMIWDTLLSASFKIRMTRLVYTGFGEIVAVGSAKTDSVENGNSGLLFVRFDTSGSVLEKKENSEADFIAAGKITQDVSGNILLALTRKSQYSKPRASVAKYSFEFNKLWETELYNNTSFGAAGRGILTDEDGNVYVAGNTEIISADSVLNNSFLTSTGPSGTVRWKKYLEKSNLGTAIIQDETGLLMMLHTNCFVVSIAAPEDGADEGRIRMFEVCNAKETDAFGEDIDLNYEGNIIVAGTRGQNYFLAMDRIE